MNPLTLHTTVQDPFVVLTAVGEIDFHTQDQFERAVLGQLEQSPVVVDLAGVEFLAISALRSLMACNAAAARHGREVYYARAPGQVLRLLEITGLDEVLPLRESVTELICPSAEAQVLVRPTTGLANQSFGDLAQLDVG